MRYRFLFSINVRAFVFGLQWMFNPQVSCVHLYLGPFRFTYIYGIKGKS